MLLVSRLVACKPSCATTHHVILNVSEESENINVDAFRFFALLRMTICYETAKVQKNGDRHNFYYRVQPLLGRSISAKEK